jgi:CBS domain-containing protein
MQAKDVMRVDPAVVTPADTVEMAAQAMLERDCGALPVVADADTRRVIGIVTDRDIAIRGVARGKGPTTRVSEVMTRSVTRCPENADIADVERTMADRQIRRVVIVDNDESCVGIVSQADIARAAKKSDVAAVVERISEPRA